MDLSPDEVDRLVAGLLADNVFGRGLLAARQQRAWSQAALADRAGLGRDTIRDLEVGRTIPRLDTLLRLLIVLETDLAALVPLDGGH